MKRILSISIALILLIGTVCACAQNDDSTGSGAAAPVTQPEETANAEAPAEPQASETEGDKVLILYFSAANTKDVDAVTSATPLIDGVSSVEWLAEEILRSVGGDMAAIIPSVDYPLVYNDLADYAKEEADSDARPAFEDLGVNPTSYDTVFLGYPIWWYRMPMILETFFDTYDFSGVTIVPFNTHEGSGNGGTYRMIQEREPNATVLDGFAVRGANSGKDSTAQDLAKWLENLEL